MVGLHLSTSSSPSWPPPPCSAPNTIKNSHECSVKADTKQSRLFLPHPKLGPNGREVHYVTMTPAVYTNLKIL
eukprot:389859-Amphidinium_carterae.1